MFSYGFHVGPTGHGIPKEKLQALHDAGIPFFVKSAGAGGHCLDAVNIARGGNVPHTIIFRLLTTEQYDHEVPPYSMAAKDAAAHHWGKAVNVLPPEVKANKDLIWIEVCNEVDKTKAGWVGNFMTEIAILANSQGYKVTGPAWSSGEPELAHWATAGMLRYLRYCAENRGKAAVSVHEYDYEMLGFSNVYPFHIGRFRDIFTTCDLNSIPYPEIHITEWGWSQGDIPTISTCMSEIDWAYKNVYGQFSEWVRGVSIWCLQKYANNIHDKVKQLITPVMDYNLSLPAVIIPPTEIQTRDFEDGHTDHPLYPSRIQIPTGFQVSPVKAGQPLWYKRKGQMVNATGTVEAKRLECGKQLPLNQCVGGSDPLIIKGKWNYKVQAVNMQSGTAVSTVFTGNGRCRVTVPINVHWQVDVPNETDDVYVALLLNGVEVERLQHPELKDRKWMELTGEAELPVTVELRFQTSWANSRDCFTDYWQCETIEEPPMGNYKSVVFKLAQEHTREEWQAIAGIAYDEYKRTMTASHDNCIVMVGDGNSESYAVVFDPQLPSQQTAIAALQEAGLNYQTRPFRGQ